MPFVITDYEPEIGDDLSGECNECLDTQQAAESMAKNMAEVEGGDWVVSEVTDDEIVEDVCSTFVGDDTDDDDSEELEEELDEEDAEEDDEDEETEGE